MAARQSVQWQDSDPGFAGIKGEQGAIVEGRFVLLDRQQEYFGYRFRTDINAAMMSSWLR